MDLRSGIWDLGFPRAAAIGALVVFLLTGALRAAGAQDADAAAELGHDALSKRHYPWYDREADDIRPLRIGKESTTSSSSNRVAPSTGRGGPGSSGAGALGLFGSVIQVVGLLVLTLVLVGVAALIAWAFLRNESAQTTGARVVAASREADRVEELPIALKRTSGDLLSEARRLAEAGNYSEAIIYLYSHFLVQLDKHHVIRLAKGKTNRQYLRETRPRPVLAGVLETAMVAFEDVFFGHHQLERQRFEECVGQMPAFEADLARLERAAA